LRLEFVCVHLNLLINQPSNSSLNAGLLVSLGKLEAVANYGHLDMVELVFENCSVAFKPPHSNEVHQALQH
jgi:hypothetical protein